MDDFARVKDAVDLVDVVSRYVPLKRAGTRMVGLCPFHAEKSPSFGIKSGEKFFKCFGCGKGGDVFTFVSEIERIERVDALRRLAEEAGIELSRGDFASRDDKERLLRALEAAQDLYRRAYASEIGAHARALIESRRLSVATADLFGLGFAPIAAGDVWRSGVIANRLVKSGHRREDVVAAGLALERDGELVDSMRERVTIPIRDERGRVIAFGGRRMRDERDGEEVKDPKYINSRETLVFSKSRVLYGLDRARAPILKQGRIVLVEGYMDVILAHQGGLDTAVAALGTSVTSEHAKHLARLAPKAVLFLDGDTAGQRAAERAVPLLLAEKLEVRVLVLVSDKDPGDYFARGATQAEFDQLLEKDGVSGLDYLLARAGRREARSIDDRIRVARKVGEALLVVVDPLARAAAVTQVARELDLPAADLDAALGLKPGRRTFNFGTSRGPTGAGADAAAAAGAPFPGGANLAADGKNAPDEPSMQPASAAQVVAEEELLIALLLDATLRPEAARRRLDRAIVDPLRGRLFLGLVEERDVDPVLVVETLLGKFSGEPEAQQKLLDLVHRPASAEAGKLFDGAVRFFEQQVLKRKASQIRADFEKRLAAGDPGAAAEFLKQFENARKASGTN